MKSIIRTSVLLLFTGYWLFTGCCPSPCITWILDGPTVVEPTGFVEPTTPAETEEFIFYKGKGGSLHNFSKARETATEDLYNQIFNSISLKNSRVGRGKIQEIAISGVIIQQEFNVKSSALYRHSRKSKLTSIGVKYEVIIIARFPKYAYFKN